MKRLRERLAYELESWRMGQEDLKEIKAGHPELYVKGFWRMTPAEAREAVRKAGA